MILKTSDPQTAAFLFRNWEETIIWSCLQGIMGETYVDNTANHLSAMAILGDFAFFAGKPNRELALFKPGWCTQNFMIIVPQNAEWEELLEQCYGTRAKKISRYAFKKEQGLFDKNKLEQIIATLPADYELHPINKELYYSCRASDWSRDLVSQFPEYENYRTLGLGVVILHHGEIVSGASSYSRYADGIEIEIDTQKIYRRQGLASVCGAALILECLKRNLYPSWDAHNLCSVALAQKLGYHYSHEYTAYEIRDY